VAAPFARLLLRWYDAYRRDLPWRRSSDPWAIWVSEVMLQQTRVEAVRGAFTAFLARYPTPAAFADASDDELQSAWRGLGYYRRARLLRDGARAVCEQHGGSLPDDPHALGELPGIGAYTRGAIASIAFGRRELAIDGNVERVASRQLALRDNVKLRPAQSAIAAAVSSWQDPARPGDFNQALMELGATVCLPGRAPLCARCPVAASCRAHALGVAAELPVRPAKPEPVPVQARAAWIVRGQHVLAHRIPVGEVNAGQMELPGPGLLVSLRSAQDLARVLRSAFGLHTRVGGEVASVRHAITNHRITLSVHKTTCSGHGSLFPADPRDRSLPWTTASRKVFAALARS
jgi:A/G-specific adenine glycosylase